MPQHYDPNAPSAQVIRSFGLETLVEIIETIGYGVCVTGENATWTYVNPAGARIVGTAFEDLQGTEYLASFAEHERASLLALEEKQREGDTGFYTNTLIRDDGTETQITWSGTVVTVDGQEVAPAFFHEVTDVRRAQVAAVELGASAATNSRGGSTTAVLNAVVEEAVAATRAVAAILLLEDAYGLLRTAAVTGMPASLPAAIRSSPVRLDELPAGGVVLRGRGGFLHDDRERLLAAPKTRSWVEAMEPIAWRGAAKVPVRQDGRVVGVLVVVIPERVAAPSGPEMALWERLAEQAEIALGTDRVRDEAARTSASLERERIARDLHDSVNHAIFALQARAQAVTRALDREHYDLARSAASELGELARLATGEMRSLLTELRETNATPTGLYAALRGLADLVSRRDGLPVAVAAPEAEDVELAPSRVEHLVRIAGEALHNTVKHAGARRATLTAIRDGGELVLTIEDDGRGFDTGVARSVGHGQRTMRERAELVGAEFSVVSRPGEGTTVVVRVPVNG